MTDRGNQKDGNASPDHSPTSGQFSPDFSIRLPKNKSTGNLLRKSQNAQESGRTRFSFDAGTVQQLNTVKRSPRVDHENVFGVSGLRRIRRQGPSLQLPAFRSEDVTFIPPPLTHARTLPDSISSSRSPSAHQPQSGATTPVVEDLRRFPTESLHSFSFARQSEDFLHSRETILEKSVDFMRDRLGWAADPGLANAQARVSGNSEIQGVMELLKRANILSVNTRDSQMKGLGIGPMTGPADVNGRNPFEKSFSMPFEPVEEAIVSPTQENEDPFHDPNNLHTNTKKYPPTENDPSRGNFISPPPSQRTGLKRTYTDLTSMSLQLKLMEALAQPYSSGTQSTAHSLLGGGMMPVATSVTTGDGAPSVHSHSSKWANNAQAVFRTNNVAPWTILAANDLACLVFGVTRAEVRHLGILEVIQEDRRQWLEDKLRDSASELQEKPAPIPTSNLANGKGSLVGARGGITAMLLNKAPSRAKGTQRAQTENGSAGYNKPKEIHHHPAQKSRGVLLCGDVIPIQRRNGTKGAASFWVMEKRGGLIWVIEEIIEDVACLKLDKDGCVSESSGDVDAIWGDEDITPGTSISVLLPHIPIEFVTGCTGATLYGTAQVRYFTARTADDITIPTSISKAAGSNELRVASFPHIAGVMVLDPATLMIKSSNSVFSAALFGYERPAGLSIGSLIPSFESIIRFLTDEEDVDLVDGVVIPEHSFRRVRAMLALQEGRENAANIFLRPSGLAAKHRDGSEIMVDVQMRVIKNDSSSHPTDADAEKGPDTQVDGVSTEDELLYALWITYSRQLHSIGLGQMRPDHPLISRPITPPRQPSPPTMPLTPETSVSEDSSRPTPQPTPVSLLSQQIRDSASAETEEPLEHPGPHVSNAVQKKKCIDDFIILEEMGSGAYGQVKLARYRMENSRKMVLKFVVKKRILVDTWTRDRRLGTVPLEIHVMDYLRRDDLRHPNIVEMVDFFEDNINYYIEMLPHGIPGMDLFDYIELRANMAESECKNIFRQVVSAIHHLHTKAFVVHRDVKDENVVLDGEGQIKLIDFGSATYIKNGPFDVFVGTIDYAAPEVLQGKPYRGTEQDVWALGILLYTIVYKENPFYNIDEILDHPLRIPYLPFSEECIDLIRKMLDRDVDERITISEVRDHSWLKQESSS